MSTLFRREYVAPTTLQDSPVRFSASAVISVATHLALVAVLLSMAKPSLPSTGRAFKNIGPRLVALIHVPPAPVDIIPIAAPVPASEKTLTIPEPEPPKPEPVPVKTIENRVEPAPKAAEVRPVEPPKPAPAPPSPTVGLFDTPAAMRAPQPAARVETAGFDLPVQQKTESRTGQAVLAGFDSAPNIGARQSGSANAIVADTGFNRQAAAPQSQPGGVIREGGFGDSAGRDQAKARGPAGEVRQAGFANAAATEAPRRAIAAPARPVVTPVEVLSKPTPVYTEQARKMGIQGEVVIEVEFAASGQLKILRVVRGLGYGLDEAAVKAAEQIRFKPARDGERAVDFKTTVQIVFRLA